MLYFNKGLNATSTIDLAYSKHHKYRISFDGLNEQTQCHEFPLGSPAIVASAFSSSTFPE
tara:strand:- start:874 stop:1053 length:180 start_codon:yes stop_codon:yes gene_type:complete